MSDLLPDGTRECDRCGLPMMPVAERDGWVTLECANRHRHTLPLPSDREARELERTIRLTEDILRHLVVRRDE